jgi:hypothetical protein
MALKKYDDFRIPKILNFKFIRYLNALFGVSKLVSFRRNSLIIFSFKIIILSLIVLEIESLFHNKRISEKFFDEIIFNANNRQTSFASNKTVFETDLNEVNSTAQDLSIRKHENFSLFEHCKTCNENSLNLITEYNSKRLKLFENESFNLFLIIPIIVYGIIIGTISMILCFIFAYNYDFRCKYKLIFIPVSLSFTF